MRHVFVGIFTIILATSTSLIMNGQHAAKPETAGSGVTVKAQFVSLSGRDLRIKAVATNSSNLPVFLVIEPKDRFKRDGFYVSLGSSSETEIDIASQLYPPAFPTPATNGTHVKVKKLEPGESHSEVIGLVSPLRESMPPRGNLTFKVENGQLVEGSDKVEWPRDIDLSKLRSIHVTYGYFRSSQAIENFLRSKSWGWYILGNERLEKDDLGRIRTFLDIQELATVKLNLPAHE